jgi:hypothetical protein
MDKLDKVPPKEITPFKDRPIAQGIISNTIFQIAWNGVSAVIGVLTRYYALIYGIPPFLAIFLGVLAFFFMALSVNLLRRRKEARALHAATGAIPEPAIEILSPFDHDEVGLYETVRGHVSPPDQELQVAVFAGDKKWYPQKPARVKGSTWSVKCQFGNLEHPSSGSYKVVALLGNDLEEECHDLPRDTPKSNTIIVHRPEVTTEHELKTARNDRDKYKGQLQTATNAFADKEEQVEALTTEKTKLERELLALKKDKHTLEQSLENTQRDLNKVTSETNQPDQKRLQLVAKQDRENIQDSVIVTGIHFRNETTYGNRHIDFVFALFNQSLYEITIDDLLGDGDIVFDREPFVKNKEIVNNKAQNIPARASGHFTVRQYLDAGDIEAVKAATDDRLFGLHNLRIKIKGGAGFEQIVTEKQLQFSCSLSKQYPIWLNHDGPFRSKFNGSIAGHISEIYFQTKLDLFNSQVVSQDNFYDLFFVMRTYIANHGAPTSIHRFNLAVKANGVSYQGKKQSLNEFHVIRPEMKVALSDIEDHNDVTLADSRRGWLRFVVHGVRRYEEDKPELTIELDVIDKSEDVNRITPLPQSEWRRHSRDQESYISGVNEWQI